ncbi:plasma membrane H+-ATPase [Ceratobasidium sp. 370]|nr:plasma membrane H+-ATPase [Ceratobasidium sp. 370]
MIVQDSREYYSYNVVKPHLRFFHIEDYSKRPTNPNRVSADHGVAQCRTAWAECLRKLNRTLEGLLSEGDLTLQVILSIEAERYQLFETTERDIIERCAQTTVRRLEAPHNHGVPDDSSNNDVPGEAPPSYAEATGLDRHVRNPPPPQAHDEGQAGTSQNPIEVSDEEESESEIECVRIVLPGSAAVVRHAAVPSHLRSLAKDSRPNRFFCLASIGLFVLLEIVVLYPRSHYLYRRGLDNILVLLIGGIPIVMPTVLSVTLAVGVQQFAQHKAIITRITPIEELAGVIILCSDRTGTLTTNKLTIDKNLVKTYGPFSPRDITLLAAHASRTEDQDAIDEYVDGTLDDPGKVRASIKLLDFKPFNPVDKRTEITYCEESSGKLKLATKGMTSIIIELCTRNKTEEVENQLEADVTEFASHSLRACCRL